MISIKLKFRASTVPYKKGQLFFQIIQDRTIRRVNICQRIFTGEWNSKAEEILLPAKSSERYDCLKAIKQHCIWEMQRFMLIAKSNENSTIDDIVKHFVGSVSDQEKIFVFLRRLAEQQRQQGKERKAEITNCLLRSFATFRGGIDIELDKITKEMIGQYEAFLTAKGLKRNTTSFYMRNFRSAYKAAVEEGLASDGNIFAKVYTGVDKTTKRAIAIDDIRRIKHLNLDSRPALAFARDILLMIFYLLGISFVDLAYLQKTDVQGDRVSYHRKKTGKFLNIQLPKEALAIISKYRSETKYLLPIIMREDGTERRQYKNVLMRINRNLKEIGRIASLPIGLSTYVMRHSWATIARDKGIELSVISEALGHDSELTTQIYLNSISAVKVDMANRAILDDL